MAQVSTIALTNINNSAHFLFLKDIVDRASNDSNITKNCAAQVEALQKAVQEEDACSNISNKSLATDKIAEADRLRDKLYLGYKRSVSAYLDFPDADCANAAKILNQHIIDYNINVLDQLHKETGALVGFIKDLETIHKNLVETLNLTRFVDHLKAANETVREHTDVRTNERSVKVAGATKQARIASDNAYRDLINHINARMMLEGEAAYEAFAAFVNTQIAEYKQSVVSKRKTKTEESPAENSPLE